MPRAPPVTIATLPLSFMARPQSSRSAVGWAKAPARRLHAANLSGAVPTRSCVICFNAQPRGHGARETLPIWTCVQAPLPTLHRGERALVVAEIEILLGRGRLAAPGAEHVGAQLQRVLEAVEVELAVNCESVLRERE